MPKSREFRGTSARGEWGDFGGRRIGKETGREEEGREGRKGGILVYRGIG